MDFRDIYGEDFPALKKRLNNDFGRIMKHGIIKVSGKKCVTGYSYGELFDWDLYFENLVLSYFGVSKYCKTGVESFLDRQEENGFISRTLGVVWPKKNQHFKPFLAQTALLYLEQTNDLDWLRENRFQQLKKYLEYWLKGEYASSLGFPTWNSADHSGMDNQDERAGAINSYVCMGVELSVFLVKEFEAMTTIAQKIDLQDESLKFAKKAKDMNKKISDIFWDEECGFFYDINVRTNKYIKCKTVAGFSPLWTGAATKLQAERIIEQHLLNKDEFWLKYPVASMSKCEPGYRQEKYDYEDCCNWKGPTWMPTNYYVFRGLLRYGFESEAKSLAEKTFDMLMRNHDTREYYNAETGEGLGLNPFWGWSVLGYFMPFEYHINSLSKEKKLAAKKALTAELMGGQNE